MKTIQRVLSNAFALLILAALILLIFLMFGSRTSPLAGPAAPGTTIPSIVPLISPTEILSPSTSPSPKPSLTPTALQSPTAILSPVASLTSKPTPPSLTPLPNPSPTAVRWKAEKIRVSGERPIDPTGNAIFLTWSPDGKRILFRKTLTSYDFGDQLAVLGDLWLANIDGSNRRLLAKLVGYQSWSPDGKWIAYSTPDQASGIQGTIYLVDTSSFTARKLTSALFNPGPDLYWLPGGELTFLRGPNIYAIQADNLKERQLNTIQIMPPGQMSQNIFEGMYAISPNGTKIAYVPTSIQNLLWLSNLDGTGATKVTDKFSVSAGHRNLAWSPDSSALAFSVLNLMSGHIW